MAAGEALGGRPIMPTVILTPTREERLVSALHAVSAPIPGTKGFNPRERAQRLHAELERRIRIARDALGHQTFEDTLP